MRRILSLVLAFLAFSGCLAATSEPVAVDPEDVGVPTFLAMDHDHEDPSLHEGASGLALAAYLPICDARDPCSFGELDVMGDLAILALLEPDGGFVVIDVADPHAPKVLSITLLGRAVVTDVKLAPDGKTAFVAVSNWAPWVGKAGLRSDPSSAVGTTRSQGVHVYDLTNPAKPVARWFEPIGAQGVHMLDVHVIQGEMIVVATTPAYFLFAPPDVRSAVEPITITRFDAASGRLVHLADYVPPEADVRGGNGEAAHDITLVDDPTEGPLLLATFIFGVAVASLAEPAAPKHLGTWLLKDAGFDTATRNTHTAMMQYVEGRRVLVATPEQGESSEMYVVDAEDLKAMRLLGTWHLPGDLEVYRGIEWSMHNVNLLDGKAYVAHYHGGVWVLDVSTPALLAAPRVLGYYAPRETGQVGPGLPEVWAGPTAPNTWDVVPGKGVVFASDITSGFYVLDAEWAIPLELPYGARGT